MIGLLGLGRHSRLRGLLSPFVDGETSPAETALVERHLAQCAECQQELDSLRATVGLLKALPELQVPRAFTLAIEPAEMPRPATLVWASGFATSLAAVLLVALLLGDLFEVVTQSDQEGPAVAGRELESLSPEREVAPPVAAAARAAPPPLEDQEQAAEASAALAAAAPKAESAVEEEAPAQEAVAVAQMPAPEEPPSPAMAAPVPPIEADTVTPDDESAGVAIPLWQTEVAAASASATAAPLEADRVAFRPVSPTSGRPALQNAHTCGSPGPDCISATRTSPGGAS